MCRINIESSQREVKGILDYFENSKHLNNTLKFDQIKKVLNYKFFKIEFNARFSISFRSIQSWTFSEK